MVNIIYITLYNKLIFMCKQNPNFSEVQFKCGLAVIKKKKKKSVVWLALFLNIYACLEILNSFLFCAFDFLCFFQYLLFLKPNAT